MYLLTLKYIHTSHNLLAVKMLDCFLLNSNQLTVACKCVDECRLPEGAGWPCVLIWERGGRVTGVHEVSHSSGEGEVLFSL